MAVAAPVPARASGPAAAIASAERRLRLVVFTTSYPRHPDDFAGRFVSDAVDRLRELGHDVEVVGPGVYRDFGLAYDGRGIVANVRRRPWLAPLLFVSMVRALRRAARSADLVHAHWLAGGVVAAFSGRPFVVTLHGSISGGPLDDFRLCERHPRLVRAVLRRARGVVCVSEALTGAARGAGVPDPVFIPNGIAVPETVGEEAEPPEVFYTGRLSPEKGILDLVRAAEGLDLVVCGDGPLRHLVPQSRGFVSREELDRRFAAAAVVVCPSRSEGFGVVCGEAMAHGKPVVACATGGLVNLVRDGETGLLVEPGDVAGLRRAIDTLLADPGLRRRFGAAARARIRAHYSWESVIARTLDVYHDALPGPKTTERRPYAILDEASRRAKAEKIARIVGADVLEGARVLDVGCGSGHIAAMLARLVGSEGAVHAVDVRDQRLVREGYVFRRVEGTVLPFPDRSLDVVLSNHVIEHVGEAADQLDHLREVRRVLRPGGLCYLAVPSRWVLVEPHVRLPLLSWLPRPFRSPYVRLARRGDQYDCELPSRRLLRRLFRESGLEATERTLDALVAVGSLERPSRAARLALVAPAAVRRALLPLSPTLVYVLRRPG